MKNFPPCAQLLNHQVQGLIQGLEEISQQPLVVPSEVEDDARWRKGKGLELGFELEQAHFIFINIILISELWDILYFHGRSLYGPVDLPFT